MSGYRSFVALGDSFTEIYSVDAPLFTAGRKRGTMSRVSIE
ncbi:hypothetical protein [Streptosporangium roseum]|nr:hypothetical protein [Streptosporangium roseum]